MTADHGPQKPMHAEASPAVVTRWRSLRDAVVSELRAVGLPAGTSCNGVADGEELWELLDAFAKRLKKAGIERPSRPRGRPRAITIIEADDGGQTRWLPNFHPPGTPEHERYDEAMRRAGKKPGDPL